MWEKNLLHHAATPEKEDFMKSLEYLNSALASRGLLDEDKPKFARKLALIRGNLAAAYTDARKNRLSVAQINYFRWEAVEAICGIIGQALHALLDRHPGSFIGLKLEDSDEARDIMRCEPLVSLQDRKCSDDGI